MCSNKAVMVSVFFYRSGTIVSIDRKNATSSRFEDVGRLSLKRMSRLISKLTDKFCTTIDVGRGGHVMVFLDLPIGE